MNFPGSFYVSPAGGDTPNAGALRVAHIHITASQISQLNNTPIVGIPAPGVGKMILVVQPQSLNGVTVQCQAGDPWDVFGDLFLAGFYGAAENDSRLSAFFASNSISGLLGTDVVTGQLFLSDGVNLVTQPNHSKANYENQALYIRATGDFSASLHPSLGRLITTTLQNGGTGYAIGDTFILHSDNSGNDDATGVVDTVDGGGTILTYHMVNRGTNYIPGSYFMNATSGGGSAGRALINDIQSVVGGNGDIALTIPYVMLDLLS